MKSAVSPLLKLLSDQKNHSLNDAVTLNPSYPVVEWHRLAQNLKHQGLVEHSWLKGETVITDAGVENFRPTASLAANKLREKA